MALSIPRYRLHSSTEVAETSRKNSTLLDAKLCESLHLLQPHVCDGTLPLGLCVVELRAYSDTLSFRMYLPGEQGNVQEHTEQPGVNFAIHDTKHAGGVLGTV